MPMIMIPMMMVMVLVNRDAGTHSAHTLFHDIIDDDFEGVYVERFQLVVELLHRNPKPNQRTENHVAARSADTFKMKCTFFHSGMQNDRF